MLRPNIFCLYLYSLNNILQSDFRFTKVLKVKALQKIESSVYAYRNIEVVLYSFTFCFYATF